MNDLLCQPCIAAMPASNFWILFSGAVVAALITLYYARQNFFKARLIEDMPTSKIRSASQGYVELAGTAMSEGADQIAPLTGQRCLWWRYTIERYEKSGKSSTWRTVDKGISSSPFYMSDGTGTCRIEPNGAEISCLHRKVWRGSSRVPPTATIRVTPTLLDRINPLGGYGRYRYTESLIKNGDPLYLLGHFVSDPTGIRVLSIDQIVGQIISSWKKDFNKLLIQYDKDGNGVLDSGEWDAVREAASISAASQQLDNSRKTIEHSVIKPEDDGLPYLIGSRGQEALSSRFRWRAVASAIGFLAFGTAATWLFDGRFFM